MSYSTPAMVRLALAPFATYSAGYDASTVPVPNSNTGADLTNDQLADAISQADATIDAYIGGQYVTPVAQILGPDNLTMVTPHPIDFWSRDIAAYLATLTYRKNQDVSATDPIQLRYNMILTFLQNIQTGKGVLNIQPASATDSSQSGAGNAINPYDGDLFGASQLSIHPVWPGDSDGYPTPGGLDGWGYRNGNWGPR